MYWHDQWAWWCALIVLIVLYIIVGAYSYFTYTIWAVAFVALASAVVYGIYLVIMHSWSYYSLYMYADKISSKGKRFKLDKFEKKCDNGFASPIHARRYGLMVIILLLWNLPGQFIQFGFMDPILGAIYTQYIILGAQAVSLVLFWAFISGIGWTKWCDYDLVSRIVVDYLKEEQKHEESSEESEESDESGSEKEGGEVEEEDIEAPLVKKEHKRKQKKHSKGKKNHK